MKRGPRLHGIKIQNGRVVREWIVQQNHKRWGRGKGEIKQLCTYMHRCPCQHERGMRKKMGQSMSPRWERLRSLIVIWW